MIPAVEGARTAAMDVADGQGRERKSALWDTPAATRSNLPRMRAGD